MEHEKPSSAARVGQKIARIKPMAESARSRMGIRGVHSTDEGVQENALEGRSPALVELELRVSARAWA